MKIYLIFNAMGTSYVLDTVHHFKRNEQANIQKTTTQQEQQQQKIER